MAADEATPSVDVVELDGLVVLKIIKHCHEALPGFVTGQLLGLDIGRTLEVTNCFAFPTKDDDAGGGGKGDGDDDEDGAEYQIEMMRSLREVNVDNNTVGWYQSTYFSSFIDDSCIETQFNYQENIKNCCVIIYDPSRARAAGLALRAFRLTDAFMAEYKEGKFAGDAAAAAASGSEIFQELPLKVRNSHLASALLLELQDEVGFPSTASDFSRLELHTNPSSRSRCSCSSSASTTCSRSRTRCSSTSATSTARRSSRQTNARAARSPPRRLPRESAAAAPGFPASHCARHPSDAIPLAATVRLPAQKKIQAQERERKGEEPRPEEDTSTNPLFKPIPAPSRLRSLLIANQMQAYCQQINQFTGAELRQALPAKSVNAGGE